MRGKEYRLRRRNRERNRWKQNSDAEAMPGPLGTWLENQHRVVLYEYWALNPSAYRYAGDGTLRLRGGGGDSRLGHVSAWCRTCRDASCASEARFARCSRKRRVSAIPAARANLGSLRITELSKDVRTRSAAVAMSSALTMDLQRHLAKT